MKHTIEELRKVLQARELRGTGETRAILQTVAEMTDSETDSLRFHIGGLLSFVDSLVQLLRDAENENDLDKDYLFNLIIKLTETWTSDLIGWDARKRSPENYIQDGHAVLAAYIFEKAGYSCGLPDWRGEAVECA